MTTGTNGRCVHCLQVCDALTADHVIPNSWYPETTPATVQRWTVPSCPRCNRALGQLEQDLLIRLALCVNPKSEAAAGLAARAFRSLGFDTEELSNNEKARREKLRAKIRSEMMPQATVAGKPGKILGLGPPEDQPAEWAIPIPWAGLAIVAEKIARGCEYKIKGRIVERPYGIRTFVSESGVIQEPYAAFVKCFDFGPGCSVRRVFAAEDHKVVIYWISIWGSLNLTVHIDLEQELQKLDQRSSRVTGLLPEEHQAVQISSYLRNQQLDDLVERRTQVMIEETHELMNRSLEDWIEPKG